MIQGQIAGLPQPKIQLDGQDVYAVAGQMYTGVGVSCTVYFPTASLPSNPCLYDNYLVQESALNYLAAAGVTMVDINIGVLPLASSAEYKNWWTTYGPGYGWGSTPLVASDCAAGATLTFGHPTSVPPGSGPWCKTLAVWDDIVNHASALGLKIRLAPTPSTEQAACVLPTNSLEKCYGPLYYAAAARWGSAIDSLTVIHEPSTGGVWGMNSLARPFSAATVRAFIEWCYQPVHLANASTAVGAAAVTSQTASQEAGFWADWLTNLASSSACGGTTCMDYFALDVYASTWDASVYGAVGGQFLCSANNSPSSPCYSQTILSPCAASTTDTANDCQWFISSSTSAQSGDVLSAATYASGTLPTSGTCTFKVTDGGPLAQGALLQLAISGSTVTTAVLNVGSGFTAAPTQASPASGPCSMSIVISGMLAGYANGGALNLAATLAENALTVSEPVRINECNRPVFVVANCAPQGSNGVFDNDYIEWAADGMDTEWFAVIAAWASANGFSSVSPFATQMWAWYNSVNINATPPCSGSPGSNMCPAAFPYQLVWPSSEPGIMIPYVNLSPTSVSGQYWMRTAQWVSASLQGNSKLTGYAQLK